MLSAVETLTRETLQDKALRSLRLAIQTGELGAGQRLVESELAAQMGVSRVPVREALMILERDGLVVTEPGRGATVVNLSDDDVHEIYGMRVALETYAVELLLRRATEERLAILQSLVDGMRAHALTGARVRLGDLDLEFHRTLCQLAGNQRLVEAWRPISDQIRLLLQLKDRVVDDSMTLPQGHQLIVDAIRGGDLAQAQQVLRIHISRSAEKVLGEGSTDL